MTMSLKNCKKKFWPPGRDFFSWPEEEKYFLPKNPSVSTSFSHSSASALHDFLEKKIWQHQEALRCVWYWAVTLQGKDYFLSSFHNINFKVGG